MTEILQFILILSVLIIGHEIGHFLAALLCRIPVDEFGIGYPPRLVKLLSLGETEFTLNWIPFGGFVRPRGQDDPSVPKGLAGASKRCRVAVLTAGPLANVLMAFIAFSAAFRFASPDTTRVLVTGVAPNSPAESAGIQVGDIFVSVEGDPIESFENLQVAIGAHLGELTSMTLKRDGEEIVISVVPRRQPPQGEGAVGIILGYPTKMVSWFEAMEMGLKSLEIQITETLRLPARLIRGEVEPEQARGVGLKGMYDLLSWAGEVDRTAQRPFVTLNLIGVISMGLAIANLLPFPALDGGRLMFVLIEAIIGRRVSPKYEMLAHTIGFALLLAILVYINLQDFINPITLPD